MNIKMHLRIFKRYFWVYSKKFSSHSQCEIQVKFLYVPQRLQRNQCHSFSDLEITCLFILDIS